MGCKYGLEDIIKYFEYDFSKEKIDEISAHLKECKRCSTMYSSLALTEKFMDVDVEYTGNVFRSIEGAIDKDRYKGKKRFYFLGKQLLGNMYVRGSVAVAVVFACIIFALWKGPVNWNFGKFSRGNEVEDFGEPSPTGRPTASPINENDNHIKTGHLVQSPDGKRMAEVIREGDTIFDSVLITHKDNETIKVFLENIMYTHIESFSWIDNVRIALRGLVNPSLEVYVVIDTSKGEIIERYNGLGFAWNKDKDTLYYVETSPHFGEQGMNDKIVDSRGNIYYEAESGTSIIGTIAISDDGERFAFFTEDNSKNVLKLVVSQMDTDKKLKKEWEMDAKFGEIEFIGGNAVSVTDGDGNIVNYDF